MKPHALLIALLPLAAGCGMLSGLNDYDIANDDAASGGGGATTTGGGATTTDGGTGGSGGSDPATGGGAPSAGPGGGGGGGGGPMQTLTPCDHHSDTFDQLHASWSTVELNGGMVTADGNLVSSMPSGPGGYRPAYLVTADPSPLVGCSSVIEVVDRLEISAGDYLFLANGTSLAYHFGLHVSGDTLTAYRVDDAKFLALEVVPFNLNLHRWWAISIAPNNTVTFRTSGNGYDWSTFTTAQINYASSPLYSFVGAESTAGNGGTGRLDNFNLPPP